MLKAIEIWQESYRGTIKVNDTDVALFKVLDILIINVSSLIVISKKAKTISNIKSKYGEKVTAIHVGNLFINIIPSSDLLIIHNIDEFEYNSISNLSYNRILGLTNKFIKDTAVFRKCPVITSSRVENEGNMYYHSISLPQQDTEYHQYLVDYINSTMTIFNGDMKLITACHVGDKYTSPESNILTFAESRGWRKGMSIDNDYLKQIDETFNPAKISERVSTFFTNIRNRNKLLEANPAKSNIIVDIIKNNPTKKIVTISESSDMADRISKDINPIEKVFQYGYSASYHNKLESTYILDKETNIPITYRNGKAKIFGVTSLKKHILASFHEKTIHNINVANKLDDFFAAYNIDLLILTTPDIAFIEQITKGNITFTSNPKILLIYFKETKEQDRIEKLERTMIYPIEYIKDINILCT
jgi:hypothetical protein